MSQASQASAGIGVRESEPEPPVDTEPDESTSNVSDGLDHQALNETGVDVASGLIVAGVGVAAWSLPTSWLVVAVFAFSGVLIMLAKDRRVRLVGPFITGAALFAVTSGLAATFATTAIYALVAALYHHRLIAVGEVI